jgi:aconitase A
MQVLLESALRNCDGFEVTAKNVEDIVNWEQTSQQKMEIPFKPARVILQVWRVCVCVCVFIDLDVIHSEDVDRSIHVTLSHHSHHHTHIYIYIYKCL